MVHLWGVVVALLVVMLGVGAVTGHVELRSCRTVADPRRDARMRAAFEDDSPSTS